MTTISLVAQDEDAAGQLGPAAHPGTSATSGAVEATAPSRWYLGYINAALDILNLRLLALLALLFGAAIWGYAVYDPTNWRFICASGFSAGVVWPVFWLYARKAD